MREALDSGIRDTAAQGERWVEKEGMAGLLKYSEDGTKIMAHGRVYELDDNAALSLTACPDFIAETMGWRKSDP